MQGEPLASVVLLTFNGEKYIREVLEAVFAQRTSFDFEVIVIDSGSRDKTLSIAKSYPIRLECIPNAEFNHGKTRNLGAELATGQFVAYLTQDATPASPDWLQHLVSAFEISPSVAAVYGVHRPRPDCNPIIRREMEEFFSMMGPDGQPTVQTMKEDEQGWEFGTKAFYSDVNSCLRKAVWRQIPYRPLDYAEDQAFGRDILRAGYWKVFEPRAAVIHSHSYPLLGYFRRQFDEYRGLRKAIGFTDSRALTVMVLGGLRDGLIEARHLLKPERRIPGRIRWIPYALIMRLLNRLAAYLAAKEDVLPRSLVEGISLENQARRAIGGMREN